MLIKNKELNNMKKKKVTQKMINDANRAWELLNNVGHECSVRGIDMPTELHNICQCYMSRIIFRLEEKAND
tara:strand:- start:145 stop:357 length:213 start_codon:yes stop_codon:yes gene_type:complete